MQWFIQLLRRVSIKKRLFFALLATSILPVTYVGILSVKKYEQSLNTKISSYSTQLVGEVSRNIEKVITSYETISENIMINDVVQYGMREHEHFKDYEFYTYRNELTQTLEKEFFRYSNFADIQLRLVDGEVFFGLGFELYDEKKIAATLEATKESPSNMYWTYVSSNRGGRVMFCRWIYSVEDTNEKLGYMLIIVDEKVFANEIYRHVNLGAGSDLFILDQQGAVMSSVSPHIKLGAPFPQGELSKRVIGSGQLAVGSPFTAELDSNKKMVISSWIPTADWHLVGTIPYRYVQSELLGIRRSIVETCILALLASLALSWLIYLSVSSPMKRLLQYANGISRGRLDSYIVDRNQDEMGTLSANINDMVEQLKGLIEKVQLEQTAKREAELKMLQAQINPHFLFNTLNSLKWTAMLHNNQTLAEGLESLSTLLKNTILDKQEQTTIKEDLDNLAHYATIQRLRYGDSFVLYFKVENELSGCFIPRFLLQPIVENSIIHGTRGEDDKIEIMVEIREQDGDLLIGINDNGKGFEMKHSDSINIQQRNLSGIGIANVHERIQLYYGESYGLTTSSVPDVGTTTQIRVPMVREREEFDNVLGLDRR